MPTRRTAATHPVPPLPERLAAALSALQAQGRPGELAGMARFGMNPMNRLGVAVPQLRRLARELGRDHPLATALWATAIPDAQILAAYLAEPAQFTAEQMDAWTLGMASWDVCDQACSNATIRSAAAAIGRMIGASKRGCN